MKTLKLLKRKFKIFSTKPMTISLLLFMIAILSGCYWAQNIPAALETIRAKDGSVWERVNESGFGDENNYSVVAMKEYKGHLYALTRNDYDGCELWRTKGTGWEQVLFANGATNGIYWNTLINNLFADMVVFQNKLYIGFSSGFQGSNRRSTGCEIWRYDGHTWEPVISDLKDIDEFGTITGISGCDDHDSETTARITDSAKNWIPDQWAGGVLQIVSGSGRFRKFDIISNTVNTLVIQDNELSGQTGTEFTICSNMHYINPFPPFEYDTGAVSIGDTYEIGIGIDENGFGDYWNRAVNCMVIFQNRLYVSTGISYEYGAQAYWTEDGETWTLIPPERSFNLFHDDPTYRDGKKPVVVTILSMCPSSVSGEEVLYAGGTGSTGNAGRCARMAKLTENGWEVIVDSGIDDNDTGTNENGFGDGMGCTMYNGNFMPWSLADFKNKLYVGINSIGGARVLFTTNGSSEDGSWFYSVGGDSGIPNGFDGKLNEGMTAEMTKQLGEQTNCYDNIVANLFATEDYLYAGLITSYVPPLGATEEHLHGAQLWKTADGKTWQQVIDDGFGDKQVTHIQSFTIYKGSLYLSAGKGANSLVGGLGGCKIYRMVR
jgi:hypothetical protein